MKYLYLLLLTLLLTLRGETTFAQQVQQMGNPTSMIEIKGAVKADSDFQLPRIKAVFPYQDSVGRMYFNLNDLSVYFNNGTSWVKLATGTSSGTVTSVATSYGLLGGAITTTGTLLVDTGKISTLGRLYKVTDSVYTGGTVTSVATSTGLIGGTITTTGTLQIDSTKVPKWDDTLTANRWLVTPFYLASFGYGTGSVTSVATSTGLIGGTITTSGTLQIDSSVVPKWDDTLSTNRWLVTPFYLKSFGYGTGSVTSVATSGGLTGGTITTSGSLSIANNGVTYTKMQQASAVTLLGNPTGSGANISEITLGSGLSFSGSTLTAAGSGGTVTTLSVVNANGFAGTVANATTTPAITLTTSINSPLLAGNGTAISAATTTGTGSTAVLSVSPALTSTPTAPTQTTGDNSTAIATDAFVTTAVNNAISGVNPATAVQAATTANVPGYTYSNGASGIGASLTQTVAATVVIDGYTPVLGDRILFKNQTTGANNGVYFMSTLGSATVIAVFTRSLDYDQPSDINNTGAIPVVNGTVNSATSWLLTSKVITVGSDALTYTQFTYNPSTIITNSTTAGGGLTGTYPNPTVATNANLTGPITSSGNATSITSQTGTGTTFVMSVSPALTSIPTAPTASANTNNTQIATTGYVDRYATQYTTSVSITTSYTPNSAVGDARSTVKITITAQAGALLFNAPTGSWADGQILLIQISDNGTSRALTYNAAYNPGTTVNAGVIPAATTIGKYLLLEFLYSSNSTNKLLFVGYGNGY